MFERLEARYKAELAGVGMLIEFKKPEIEVRVILSSFRECGLCMSESYGDFRLDISGDDISDKSVAATDVSVGQSVLLPQSFLIHHTQNGLEPVAVRQVLQPLVRVCKIDIMRHRLNSSSIRF
jgi:hypothetical protein